MTKKEQDAARLQALEQENLILRKQIEDQRALEEAQKSPIGDRLTSEMKKIRQKGKATGNTIVVREMTDYTPIRLWTPWGKPIGPMHPDAAIQALNRWADIGYQLTVEQPTGAQCNAWAASPQGKAYWKNEKDKRELKDKSRKSGALERLTAEIAKMSGTSTQALNHLLQQHEVRTKA